MAQLSIPQSLIGALIDIADLGTLDYFPPTERCAHWSLYDAQRRELLCPCAPAANTTTEKLFEAAAKILYENFPRYIDSPEEIIPYTSRQELVAALRRGEEEPAEEEQDELQVAEAAADPVTGVEAEVETISVEPAATEDAEVSAADTPQPAAPKPAAPKPAPSPALFAARAAQAPSPALGVPEEASVEAPAEAVAEETVPTPAAVAPAAPKPAAPKPTVPKPAVPTPGAPSPGMFRKSTLTYRPPRIEEYLEGLRARQQAAEEAAEAAAAESNQSAAATEQAAVEDQPVLAQSLPSAPAAPKPTAPKPTAPKPGAPKLAVPTPSAPAAQPAVEPVAAAPRGVTAEDRERSYRLRPSLRARLDRENISEELVRTILREGEAERINDWTIRFTHDDYRVDVNTASAEVITVIDEYDADYNEAAQASLAQGEYTSLNALELEFSERARTFLKKNPPFVFDLMLQTLNSPESVRMADGWTRIYAAQGLEIAISPDERTVLALAKTPDFHHLHAEALRKAQLDELSNTLAKQAEDKATQAENTTEEEK
ncbi:DNA repair protein [Rothia mucilaginosa]|uniref:DNA repair protein n=1 Tax=Rothia mucilaginosa TaxID=43675 RepID=UPI0034D52AE2